MPSHTHVPDIKKGEDLYLAGQHTAALAVFESVLQKDPCNVAALNDAGIAADETGDSLKAVEYYEKALALDNANECAFFNLIDLLTGADAGDLAVEVFRKYEATIPHTPEFSKYADVYREYCTESHAADSIPARTHDQQFEQAEERSRRRESVQAAQLPAENVRLTPDGRESIVQLAHHSIEQGDFDQATRLFEKALEIDPENTSIHLQLALSYYEQGQALEAARHLKSAILNIQHFVSSTRIDAMFAEGGGMAARLEQAVELEETGAQAIELLKEVAAELRTSTGEVSEGEPEKQTIPLPS